MQTSFSSYRSDIYAVHVHFYFIRVVSLFVEPHNIQYIWVYRCLFVVRKYGELKEQHVFFLLDI